MAVNHVDGTMFVSVIYYPIAAGVGAAHAGAGWLALFFMPVGLAVGMGIIYVGRRLVYLISEFGLSYSSKMHKSWIQQIFIFPFFLLYIILPYTIIFAGVFGIWSASIWLVEHLL